MGIYEEIGIRPFINAGGWTYTRYGGTIMPAPVVAAMAEASRQFVNIFDLQIRMGEAIAKMTNNEAAFVSCGAASGILLAVAACIAGTDEELAERLPDTQRMRNQIIRSRGNRGTEAEPAIRAGGGRIVDVGPSDGAASAEEYLGAITDQTAAILLILFESEKQSTWAAVVKGAHERNIPVLIDGACAVPPKENLWRYTRDLGADAFITSGGKGIHGPQSTGLVLGKRSIIEGCRFHSSPNLRIGRGMKVGKEEFAGICTALKLFLDSDERADADRRAKQIADIANELRGIPHLHVIVDGDEMRLDIDTEIAGFTADDAAKMLLDGNPSILLRGRGNRITVRSNQLQDGEEKIVAAGLRRVLAKD
jgi:uncharacterized pyridoxal phosphate-dependent enzyme